MRLVRIFRDALLAPPDGRLLQRSLLNAVLSLVGSMLAVALALGVVLWMGVQPESIESPEHTLGWSGLFGMVLFAPVVETLMLAGLLALLPERWGIVPRAIVSGLLWGGLHGLFAPMWFFGTAFAFFVFSCSYMTWRPVSFRHGFLAGAIPHALQNLVAFSLMMLTE